MTKKSTKEDVLKQLLASASTKVLTDLILMLSNEYPEVRRECFEFLKSSSSVTKKLAKRSEGEIILALWSELESDLAELDSYGGGDYGLQDYVGELLDQIRENLDSKHVDPNYRCEILEHVLHYIKSGNAGMDDILYDVAYAACYDDSDLRKLAEAFEAIKDDWPVTHARRIYRQIGDHEKYLELRLSKLEYGGDYHDLAMFYWKTGEKDKARQIAKIGLHKGKGRMDELRRFIADRAVESGDREKFLAIQFAQTTDRLSLQKYKSFRKLCSEDEWVFFEPKLLDQLSGAWRTEHLKIRMHRKEYHEALTILIKRQYPFKDWQGEYEIKTAEKLEKRYPEEILKYYLSGLGSLKFNATRKDYAHKAGVMAKVRRVLVKVIGDKARWVAFAAKVKRDNLRRPAFQQEFAIKIPDWKKL